MSSNIDKFVSSLNFFENTLLPPFKLKKHKDYQQNIDDLILNLSKEIFNNSGLVEKFRHLPECIQVEIVNKKFDILFFDLLNLKAQQVAFDTHAAEVAEHLFHFADGGTALHISENYLTPAQIGNALRGLPQEVKAKIVALDLSALRSVNDLLCLEGFSSLQTLTLPAQRSMKNMEGIETVGQRLQTLNMRETGIETLDFLKHCSALRRLNAGGCGMLADIYGIRECPTLEALILPSQSPLEPRVRDMVLANQSYLEVSFK